MADEPSTPDGIPPGHPLDMIAEEAGRDLWEQVQQWRARHPEMTRYQYLWICNRLLAEELREAGKQEMSEYNKRMGIV